MVDRTLREACPHSSIPFLQRGRCRVVRCMPTRNRNCDSGKTNKCYQTSTAFMEAAFLIQPWIATRTITDYCRLCYQARDGTGFLECKRAQLAGYNTLLASLTMETTPQFGDTLKLLEDTKRHACQREIQTRHATRKCRTPYNVPSSFTITCSRITKPNTPQFQPNPHQRLPCEKFKP